MTRPVKTFDQTKSRLEQGVLFEDYILLKCRKCECFKQVQYRTLYTAQKKHGSNYKYICKDCAYTSPTNPKWKGGRFIKGGYVYIHHSLMEPEYHYLCQKNGYAFEHRYTAAQKLHKQGKKLEKWDTVHHNELGTGKTDNHPDHLDIATNSEHYCITKQETYIKQLEKENKRLKAILGMSPEEQEFTDCNKNKQAEDCD